MKRYINRYIYENLLRCWTKTELTMIINPSRKFTKIKQSSKNTLVHIMMMILPNTITPQTLYDKLIYIYLIKLVSVFNGKLFFILFRLRFNLKDPPINNFKHLSFFIFLWPL